MDSNPIHHPSPAKKNKMLVFELCSTSDDWLGWSMDLNPIHHPSPAIKIKCSFLDYVQLLMIGRAIRAKNVNQNTKKQKRPPKSSKDKMFIFGLRSTSDDRPSDPSKKRQPKHKKTKKAPKSSKNKMFIFGLHSTSDDQPSDPSKKWRPKCKKNKKGPLSYQKIKCSFLDYVQLLMIS